MVVEINSSNIDEILSQTEKPVLIDFYATWCGPCRMLVPTLEKLDEEFADKVIIAKADVEKNSDLYSKHGVRVIPTVIFINKGELVGEKLTGVKTQEEYSEILKSLI